MTNRMLTERVEDFRNFSVVKTAGAKSPFMPQQLAHVYVKLDFKPESEYATTVDDAKGFLSSVARAAMAAHEIAESHGGRLLEVQGSLLHAALVHGQNITEMDAANAFVTDLHWAYRRLFDDQQKRVQGWRMTVDTGKTLIVAGRGVHGDDSEVSLGKAANRPAKHLYAQLELPEDRRDLKRYYVAVRRPLSATQHQWDHFDLNRSSSRLAALAKIAEEARVAEPKFQFLKAGARVEKVAMAVPLAPAGSPASPSPEKPQTYFGWVMRADLDGFTVRVEECFDDNQRLQQLAVQFYDIMETAAEFVQRHGESLAQLPWAGDNFTAASVFDTKAKYEQAIPKRLVELTLDFEKEMRQLALDCGFGGWAYGVAGGEVHGNAAGNVYLAGVEVGQRRFLIGVGEGFGRSAKAFADINPKAAEVVAYRPDWENFDVSYKREFTAVRTSYATGKTDALIRVRARLAAVPRSTTVTLTGGQQREVATRPHSR